jgi:hypothetical protein
MIRAKGCFVNRAHCLNGLLTGDLLSVDLLTHGIEVLLLGIAIIVFVIRP